MSEDELISFLLSDMKELLRRIEQWRPLYLEALSLKRKRTCFDLIFRQFYPSLTYADIQKIPVQQWKSIQDFYFQVDDLQWYLNYTEDLPISVEDHTGRVLKKLNELYESIQLQTSPDSDVNDDVKDDKQLEKVLENTYPDFPLPTESSSWDEEFSESAENDHESKKT